MDILDFTKLTNIEVKVVCGELKGTDTNIEKKVNYIVNNLGSTYGEALEYVVSTNVRTWAKVYLNWDARDYQIEILNSGSKKRRVVLRLGRRLGKSECMCVLILWYAFTQINKSNPTQYDILIVTPYETQIDLIFKRLHELIDQSPILQGEIVRDVYHSLKFANGTVITGLTAGSKSGTGAANTRGQHADTLILDEVDYMGSSEITNILNITNDAPETARVITASTPCGKHEEYYKWCTGATTRYAPLEEDINNYRFTGYVETTNKDGNGWTEIYSPSIVNKELIKMNPDTNQTYLQDIKDQLSEMRYEQEVMAKFGDEEAGVYRKEDIEAAVQEGKRISHKYTTEMSQEELKDFLAKPRLGPIIMGCDWDFSQTGCHFVGIQLDKLHTNEHGIIEPKFKVLFNIEVPRSRFTFTDAVNKIIELNDIFNFDWIAVDKGYGYTQLELLHKYGIQHPESGLEEKVVGYQFGEKIEVRDPYTKKIDNKPLKPFMVNNSCIIFEKRKIIFNPRDKEYKEEFEQYKVVGRSKNGMPIYTDENEHMIDATNLALLIFEQKYGELFKLIVSSRVAIIHGLTKEDKEMNDKINNKQTKEIYPIKNGYLSINKQTNKTNNSFDRNPFGSRKVRHIPTRRSF